MGRSKQQEGDFAQQPRLWTPMFIMIIGVALCCFMMGMGLNSGTTVYMTSAGYGSSLAGVMALVFSLAAAVARLFAGVIIDAGKCSLAYVSGLAILVVGTLLCAFFDNVWVIGIARVLQGVGFSLGTTAQSAAAADVLPEERLGEGIGYAGLGQALAMSVGPALALFLVGTDPAANLFYGLALVGMVGLVISLNARYERKVQKLPPTCAYRRRWERRQQGGEVEPERKRGLRDVLNIFEPRALPGALPMCILCPMTGFGIFFVGAYGAHLGYGGAGLFFTVAAVVMVVIRLSSKSFMDRVPAIKVFAAACLAGLVCCGLLMASGVSQVLFVAAGVFYGASMGLSLPINQTVMSRNTPSERWGAANALFWLLYDVTIGVFSAVWGVLNESFGYPVTLWCVVALIVLSFVCACVVYPADQKRWR
ncbi:MAG: MFS transporter [Coriobacteriia bacterium]|nr:MFS transporter [Coriobacteriia bacterium]